MQLILLISYLLSLYPSALLFLRQICLILKLFSYLEKNFPFDNCNCLSIGKIEYPAHMPTQHHTKKAAHLVFIYFLLVLVILDKLLYQKKKKEPYIKKLHIYGLCARK